MAGEQSLTLTSLADTKSREQLIEHPLVVDLSSDFAECREHATQLARQEFNRSVRTQGGGGRSQPAARLCQRNRVPGIYRHGVRAEFTLKTICPGDNCGDELGDTCTCFGGHE